MHVMAASLYLDYDITQSITCSSGRYREEKIVWADTILVGAGCWWLDQSMVKGCNQCQCLVQLDLRIRFWVGRHLNNLSDSKSNDARSKLLWWGNVNAVAYQGIHRALRTNLWRGISAKPFSIRLRQYHAWFRTNLKKPLTRNLTYLRAKSPQTKLNGLRTNPHPTALIDTAICLVP